MDQDVAIRHSRAYNQYCGIARGLDFVGERWTLLIVRDLLVGPKRYKDLLSGLPGIGTNLLATRLHELEQREIVRRTVLPPPAGSTVYELTDLGRALEPALLAIGRWGARFLGQPRQADALLPTAYFLALRAAFSPQAASGLKETYALRIGHQVFEVRIEDGQCTTSEGRMTTPDVVMSMDVLTLNALLMRGLPPGEALASGRVEIEGDPQALDRFVSVFNFSHAGEASTVQPPSGAA